MPMPEQAALQEPDPAKRRRVLRPSGGADGLIVTGVVVATSIGLALLWRLRVIVLLILVSLFIGALLHPLVTFVERRGIARGTRDRDRLLPRGGGRDCGRLRAVAPGLRLGHELR